MITAFCITLIVASYRAAMSPKIKTDFFCLHILWLTATFAGFFIVTYDESYAFLALIFAMLSGMYLVVQDMFAVLDKVSNGN